MKKNVKTLRCAVSALAVVLFTGVSSATVEAGFGDYTGDSFVATWDEAAGTTDYHLNVFSINAENLQQVDETFAGLNVVDGVIDAANPNAPAGWVIGATKATEVEGRNCIVLSENGDYVYFFNKDGVISDYTLFAGMINTAPTPDQLNMPVLKFDLYNNAGETIMSGNISALWFTLYEDLLLREGFGAWPDNVASIKVTLVKETEGLQGDVVIKSVTHNYCERGFVVRDEAATSPYTVSGLDPETVYYFYVTGKDADGNAVNSDIVTVDGFLTPEITGHTVDSKSGYTVTWNPVPKAEGYKLTHYTVKKLETGETAIFYDDFSKATEGTFESPVSITSLDDYTSVPGWTGVNAAVAAGMFGVTDGSFMPPFNRSHLQTPELDLSRADGVYTITFKAKGTPGEVLSLYRVGYVVDGALNMHQVTFDENGNVDETWTMNDGVAGMKISIEPKNFKKFLIDEIKITQVLPSDIAVVNDDFSKATEGTYEAPVSVSSLDEYTSIPGWTGVNFAITAGMVGVTDGSFMPPFNRSHLQTPELDLSDADGEYTITLKAKGTPGEVLSLYRVGYVVDGALNMHQVTFDENGNVDETWTMNDGVAGMKISIEPKNFKKFFLDEFVVTQKKGDDYLKTYLSTVSVEGKENTSYTFNDLTADEMYGVEVQAMRHDHFGDETFSDRSPLEVVDLTEGASVDVVEADASFLYENGRLTLTLDYPQTVTVFGMDGRMVMSETLPAGSNVLSLDLRSAIYVVRIGNQSYKLLVK